MRYVVYSKFLDYYIADANEVTGDILLTPSRARARKWEDPPVRLAHRKWLGVDWTIAPEEGPLLGPRKEISHARANA